MRVDEVPIAEPCGEDWSKMAGTRARRHCAKCDKHVHDLSAMSEGAARRLLQRSPGVCVRYTCRRDGTMVHREHRPGERLLPRFLALAGAALAAAPAFASPGVAGDAPPSRPLAEAAYDAVAAWLGWATPDEPVLMGEPPPPPPLEVPDPPPQRVMMGGPRPSRPPPPPAPPTPPAPPAPPTTIPELGG